MSETTDVPRGSYCTRCRVRIADVHSYLTDDYLCSYCAPQTDAEHAQTLVQAERSTKVTP